MGIFKRKKVAWGEILFGKKEHKAQLRRVKEAEKKANKKCCGTCTHWFSQTMSPYCEIKIPHRDALHGWDNYCTYHHPPCEKYERKES